MSKKELIAKLLEKLSEDDLKELLGEDEDTEKKEEPVTKKAEVHNIRGSARQPPSRPTKKQSGSRRACRVEPMQISSNRPNRFEDFLPKIKLSAAEKKEVEQAAAADKEARKHYDESQRVKRGSTLVDVVCCACGKQETVSRAFVLDFDRYRCNDCSTTGAGE